MTIRTKHKPKQERTAICELAEYFLAFKQDAKGKDTEVVVALPQAEWERVPEKRP